MKRLRTCVILSLGFFAFNAAIDQAAGSNSAEGGPHQRAAKQSGTQEPPRGGNPLWGVPLSVLTATRDRPLFAPSRRPPAPPAEAEAAPPPPPPPPPPSEPEKPNFTLVGTVTDGGTETGEAQSVALVRDQTTSKLISLHLGENVSGWSLRSIDAQTMTIEKDSQMVTLTLPTPGAAEPSAPPVMQAFRTRRRF